MHRQDQNKRYTY